MTPTARKFWDIVSRKRSFSKSKSLDTKLDRCLSTYHLIFYGLSHMIGAGIFVLTGHIIRDRTGSATNISFLFSGLVSIFTGLCYCEFATLIPKAGSCYTYTYLMIGELPAFIIGWTMIMELLIAIASISKGFSGALDLLCNNAINNFTLSYMPLTRNSDVWDSSVDLVAFLLLFTLFFVTLTGTNISMNINVVLAALQICFLIIIIISCFIYGSSKNYLADGGYLPFGFSSIFQGAGIAVFAFSGFESLANSAEETKEPKKSIPIALFTSLGIVIVLYVLASTGLSYMVPRLKIDQRAPFIAAFNTQPFLPFKWITGISTILATGATKLTSVYVIPRMLYAMADDGLLFRFLGHVEKRTQIPLNALVVGLFVSMILAMFVKIQILADITSMGILMSFIFVGVDLIILRYLFTEEIEESEKINTHEMKMRLTIHPFFISRNAFVIILTSLIFVMVIFSLSVLFAFKISQMVGIICTVLSAIVFIILAILLSFYQPVNFKDAFETPLMHLTPIITISLNICLLVNLPGGTWIRFLVWMSVGLLIYIFYGISNSNLADKSEEKKELILVDIIDDKAYIEK